MTTDVGMLGIIRARELRTFAINQEELNVCSNLFITRCVFQSEEKVKRRRIAIRQYGIRLSVGKRETESFGFRGQGNAGWS
jgi:hypothetical protein